MEDLHTLAAALATLGYASDSATSFAARAAHHSAELLYEAAQGDLLVTLLVGRRSSQTSIVLYLCDSVQRALGTGEWGTVSTGVNWLFLTFRGALGPVDTRTQRPMTSNEGFNLSSTDAARGAAAPGGSAPGSGGAACAGAGAAGSHGGGAGGVSDGAPPSGGPSSAVEESGGAVGSRSAGAAPAGGSAGGPGDEQVARPGVPPARHPQRPPAPLRPPLERHNLPDVPTVLSLPRMIGNTEVRDNTDAAVDAGASVAPGGTNEPGAADAAGAAAAFGAAAASNVAASTCATSTPRVVSIPDGLSGSILRGLRR